MKISVITTCYNSSDYIESTIKGVLSQKIDFELEYIISDDCSQDNTIEKIKHIKQKNSRGEIIRLIERDQNKGLVENFFGALLQTDGDYIAFCDSDDVWTDPNKLIKQVKYLKEFNNCMMTYHGFINKTSDSVEEKKIKEFDESLDKVLIKPQTSTMVVRSLLRELINKNVVKEAQSLNDQYLRFLLQGKGYFQPLKEIKPNIRLVREGSSFSTVDKLAKTKVALQSWKTFYKYHGTGNNQRYLARKVDSFQSRINWLEYNKTKSFERLKSAFIFDIQKGLISTKVIRNFRKIFFKPFIKARYFLGRSRNKG